MNKKEEYMNELDQLKKQTVSLIDKIKNSEMLTQEAMTPVRDEVKGVYLQESIKHIDDLQERELKKIEKHESKLGSMMMKGLMGGVAIALAQKAEKSETASQFVEPAMKGYRMDETQMLAVKNATEITKQKLRDEFSDMNGEEFIKSLRRGKAFPQYPKKIFKEELEKQMSTI